MRVVLDTNVVMSRYMAPRGTPARILDHWEQDTFELLVSDPILAEYERVLAYPQVRRYHRMEDEQIRRAIERFRLFAVLVTPEQTVEAITDDPTDNRLLECAVAGNADVIVSGDRHLQRLGEYEGIPIITPAAFLTLLEAEQSL